MPLIAPLFAFGDSVIDAFNPTTWAFEGSIDVNPGASETGLKTAPCCHAEQPA
jgi:hypothetical protein